MELVGDLSIAILKKLEKLTSTSKIYFRGNSIKIKGEIKLQMKKCQTCN